MAYIVEFLTSGQRQALRAKMFETSKEVADQLGLSAEEQDLLYTKMVQAIETVSYPTIDLAE